MSIFKVGEYGNTRMVVLLLCLSTAALYAGMHLLQGEIIRRRARGVAQQLATFSLHMFPLSDMPKLSNRDSCGCLLSPNNIHFTYTIPYL